MKATIKARISRTNHTRVLRRNKAMNTEAVRLGFSSVAEAITGGQGNALRKIYEETR